MPKDKPTIKEAVGAANSNDTIRVSSGTYIEYDLLIMKPLVIIGSDSLFPTVNNFGLTDLIKIVNTKGVVIRNMTLHGVSGVISIDSCNNLTFSNINFIPGIETGADGITITNSDSIRFHKVVGRGAQGRYGGTMTGYGLPGGDGGDCIFLNRSTNILIDSSELHAGAPGVGGQGSKSTGSDGKPGFALHLTNSSHTMTSENKYFGSNFIDSTSRILTSVGKNSNQILTLFYLEQNYPNPFNPSTKIGFSLSQRTHVTLSIFNIRGQQIAILLNGIQDSGHHVVTFEGLGIPSGAYFYRLKVGSFSQTKKLLMVK